MVKEQGFSLTEMLIAATITLIVMAGALTSLHQTATINASSGLMSELEQNLRAGINLMVDDFLKAGWKIPIGGIPLPSGAGAGNVVRPGPLNQTLTFNGILVLSSINPGAGLGLPVGGRPTDIVNILYTDSFINLSQTPLTAIGPNGTTATVAPATPIVNVNNAIQPGDLIAFSNANGSALQCVTQVNGQIMSFGANDPLNLNQPGVPQGSIVSISNGDGTWPVTTASRVWLISYFLDNTIDPNMPRIMRQINGGNPQAVALAIEDLQLSYDLVDGVTNPTDVKTPVAPNGPNQIRKVNISLHGRTTEREKNTDKFLWKSLATQVSLRSLSFVPRY